jgi:hypothetical protein
MQAKVYCWSSMSPQYIWKASWNIELMSIVPRMCNGHVTSRISIFLEIVLKLAIINECTPSMQAELYWRHSISPQYIWKAYWNIELMSIVPQDRGNGHWTSYFSILLLIVVKWDIINRCTNSMQAKLYCRSSISIQYIWKAYWNIELMLIVPQEVQWSLNRLIFNNPRNSPKISYNKWIHT